jgi:UDPglucose 6-dehydrogenase
MGNIKKRFGDKITYAKDSFAALTGADALVILTEWNEFKNTDLSKVKRLLKQPVILDGRNMYDPAVMKSLGFTYISTGRAPVRV